MPGVTALYVLQKIAAIGFYASLLGATHYLVRACDRFTQSIKGGEGGNDRAGVAPFASISCFHARIRPLTHPTLPTLPAYPPTHAGVRAEALHGRVRAAVPPHAAARRGSRGEQGGARGGGGGGGGEGKGGRRVRGVVSFSRLD